MVPPFGTGFGASYLLTTSPIVVTESDALLFDPFHRFREETGSQDAALRFEKESPVAKYLRHKFEICRRSYGRGGSPGTLLQFPLDTETVSRLLEKTSSVAITDLLAAFQTSATPALLFSRSIESVQWSRCSLTAPRSSVALETAVPVFSAQLQNVNPTLRSQRSIFHIMSPVESAKVLRLRIHITIGDIATEGGKVNMSSEWIVAQGYGSMKSQQEALALLSKIDQGESTEPKLSITPVPWCSVAAQVQTLEGGLNAAAPVEGRICRFAPLTSRLEPHEYPRLPWHVSAQFAPAPGGDLEADDQEPAGHWNRVLLHDVVPVVVAALLQYLTSHGEAALCSAPLHELLPVRTQSSTQLGQMCDLILDGFWEHNRHLPILAANAAPQPWFLAKHRINSSGGILQQGLARLSRQVMECSRPLKRGLKQASSPLPRSARAMWMAPQDVCFLERHDSGSEALARCLGRLGLPICLMEFRDEGEGWMAQVGHGVRILNKSGFATIVTPELVRRLVSEAPASVISAALDHNAEDSRHLLRYVTSDSCDPLDLIGCPVSLGDGTVSRFQRCSVDENQILFLSPTADAIDAFAHGAGHRLIHRACATDPILRSCLGSARFRATLNIQPLTLWAMRHELMPRCLPARWLAVTGIRNVDANATGEKTVPGGTPRTAEPTGWRCVVTDCGQLNPATILRCIRPHCPGQSSFAHSALENLYVHKPTPIREWPGKRPWGELRGWAEQTVVGGTSARTWLNSFWLAIASWVQEHEDDENNGWKNVLQAFEDVALLPGINSVAYAVGARVPTAVFTPVIWLDRVRRPLNNLLAKLGGCVPDPEIEVPEEVLMKCVNPANGIGCLRVVSWCIKQHEVAEHTFRDATREERHALLRMLGAMVEYTPAE